MMLRRCLPYLSAAVLITMLIACSASREGIPNVRIAGEPALRVASPESESYSRLAENELMNAAESPLSTFSIDVDTASWSNARRFLSKGRLPPTDSIRIEEWINYFPYRQSLPETEHPFGITAEVTSCPWLPEHRLMRIQLNSAQIERQDRPPSNLVFLLDVSGSMNTSNKLPLLKRSLRMLVDQLRPRDRVGIVVYAGASGLVLPSTSARRRSRILAAIDKLEAGGSTNGGAGIELAYQVAEDNFIEGGVNRVLIATDGDFNVGITREDDLVRLIEQQAQGGVYLTVLGFGMGNYKDSALEKLADHGNGQLAYIDSRFEAQKVLVDEIGGTLIAVAKDVKIQVEFNPARVGAWRLIGYENRLLADRDFADDTEDAGELGAGHTVTALYELAPASHGDPGRDGELRFQGPRSLTAAALGEEVAWIQLRYKKPDSDRSELFAHTVIDSGGGIADADDDTRFAAAVASFGQILKSSRYRGQHDLADVAKLARQSLGEDPNGYRAEFLHLVGQAAKLRSFELESEVGIAVKDVG